MERIIQDMVRNRLRNVGLISQEPGQVTKASLADGRSIIFASEPDIALYRDEKVEAAVEVKGGIDTAGVLERVGAALKSLSRAKEENPQAITILILPEVSLSSQAQVDLHSNQTVVNYWFTVEDVLEDEDKRAQMFTLLRI